MNTENTLPNNNPSTADVNNNLHTVNNPPAVAPTPPPTIHSKHHNLWILLVILLTLALIVSVAVSIYLYTKMQTSVSPNANVLPKVQEVDTTDKKQGFDTPEKNGWVTYSDATYTFKHPTDWTVTPGNASQKTYYDGDSVVIEAPTKTVSIHITPKNNVYGFGPTEGNFNEPFTFTIEGITFASQMNGRVDGEIKKIFVDTPITDGIRTYHVMAGTGYPVNTDSTASYDDFEKYKPTIIEIINSLKISNSTLSSWKTYKNTTFKYAVSYPPEWEAYIEVAGAGNALAKPDTSMVQIRPVKPTTNGKSKGIYIQSVNGINLEKASKEFRNGVEVYVMYLDGSAVYYIPTGIDEYLEITGYTQKNDLTNLEETINNIIYTFHMTN